MRSDAAADVRESRRSVRSADDVADDDWTGAAKTAFQARAALIVPELTLLAVGLREQSDVLDQYADDLEALRTRQAALESDLAGAQEDLEGLMVDLEQASANESLVMKDPELHARWERNRDDVEGRIDKVESRRTELEASWSRLVADREDIDARAVAGLQSAEVLGGLSEFGRGSGDVVSADRLLERLSTLSATELEILFDAHPDLLTLAESGDPEGVAEWWGSLDDGQRTALFAGAPALLGALNGLPILVRVAANRRNAEVILAEAKDRLGAIEERRELRGRVPEGGRSEERTLLEKQIEYLEQVVDGDIQLYLYQPENDRIIEMIGDPTKAKNVMSFMPGTNASLEMMYDGVLNPNDPYRRGSQQEFAAWQAANGGGDVLAFVFKDGTFPQLDELAWNGPQLNAAADRIGANYAAFHHGLDATGIGALPVVSVEHSFGSSAAGEAETEGKVEFETRVLLAPIGMKEGWKAIDGTEYYVYAAEDDINKLFYDIHIPVPVLDGLGYGAAPSSGGALEVRESGIDAENQVWKTLTGGLVGAIWTVSDSVAHHNQIISSTGNDPVLYGVADLLNGVE
ncbi:WXG100 family type VII secretion target [Agromyces sp. Root81]|uniref:WXG100 family type VII secretion target n=1 Tax=Agromyces sp. Root81 TaxID=1736601 RepID=UPI0012F7EBFA|nr:hypothetical protein [Agromyces sp. Root81]